MERATLVQMSTLQPMEDSRPEQVDVPWRKLQPMEIPHRSRFILKDCSQDSSTTPIKCGGAERDESQQHTLWHLPYLWRHLMHESQVLFSIPLSSIYLVCRQWLLFNPFVCGRAPQGALTMTAWLVCYNLFCPLILLVAYVWNILNSKTWNYYSITKKLSLQKISVKMALMKASNFNMKAKLFSLRFKTNSCR